MHASNYKSHHQNPKKSGKRENKERGPHECQAAVWRIGCAIGLER